MTDRKAAVKKKTFKKQEDCKRWEKIFHTNMMSSEDSAKEDGEEILIVKLLTWQAEIVNKMMADLQKGQKPAIKKAAKSTKNRRNLYI